MSDQTKDGRTVVSPTSIDEEAIGNHEDKSPAEIVEDVLGEDLRRDFVAAGDDHPLVKESGTKESLMSNTPAEVLKLLSDDLYQDPEVFWREWLQNHEAACIREAKRVVKAEHGIEELFHWLTHEHEALDEPRTLKLPKSSEELLEMARECGYDPVVEFRVNHDEQKVITQDNGIAMTTGEVINVWKEPAKSASGGDQSSAGNKGIGALTCFSICGDHGAVSIKTRTRRERTVHTDEPVPAHDREGFHFYSFLGGVIPIPGEVEDGFYGTRFEIPVQEGVSLNSFKSNLMQYAEVSPVKILWTEIRNGGEATDEIEATTFFEQYDQEPAITIDRPGEFALAIDSPGVVSKSIGDTDTWLLDMPIDRNTAIDLGTLWNDHVQIRNEQGLIVAGPNRGHRKAQIEELHDDDVVMPQPTADRDRLERGDDADSFWTYLRGVAQAKEIEEYSEFFNEYISRDLTDALDYLVENMAEFMLLLKMLKTHGPNGLHDSPKKMWRYFDSQDALEFDKSEAPRRAITRTAGTDRTPPFRSRSAHPKYDHLRLLTWMQEEVDYYDTHCTGDPNRSRNRRERPLYEVLEQGQVGHENIFVGRTLNHDRVRVALANRDCALIIKASSYAKWRRAPFHAEKLVDVPFERGDHGWGVPQEIHDRHTATTPAEEVDVSDHALKFRTEYGNQAIDYRSSVEAFEDELRDIEFGEELPLKMDRSNNHRWAVLFPTTHDRNVTDHTDWQRYAAIARTTVAEAERLLECPQVFLPDGFEAFLAAAPVQTYEPYTGEFEAVRVDELPAMDAGPVFVNPSETNLVNLLMGTRHEELPSDDDVYETLREHVFAGFFDDYGYNNPLTPNYVCDGCEQPYANAQGLSLHQNHCEDSAGENLADPDDPELRVCWIPDNIDRHRVARYLDMVDHQVASVKGERAHAGIRIDHDSPVNRRSVSDFSRLLERAEHLWSWDVGSAAWNRVKSTGYRMPRVDEVERGIYKALREHGIDPREHTEAQIYGALVHLLDPEVNC